MAAPSSFPLLVEGSWGPDPPKNLSTKLQLYFQSPKRSGGGGECEVRRDPENPARFLLLFSHDVRQKVLQKTNHELVLPGKGTFQLTVQLPTAPDEAPVSKEKILANESKTGENVNEPVVSEEPDTELSLNTRSEKMEDLTKESENVSSLVAFENLKANVTDMMLTLLVENVSGLTSDDFQVEVIQDFRVAVVTFKKHTDTVKFVYDCARHNLIKKFNLSPRLLEETKTIRVENLPPGVDDYQLQLFFENPYHGGGKVSRVECFPEESSALVEFCDRKVLDTVMTKKHNFNKMPLSVFPYYTSLGTALYGKEQPLIKLPAPFQESLDLPLWKFFQKKDHLIKELHDEMRRHHCELTWSQQDSKVTIRPAATLVSQGRLRVKTWKKDASAALADIRSAYAVSSFKVAPAVWDTVKNDLEDDTVLIEFDTSKETLTLAGKSDDIRSVSPQIKELLERTTQKIQREEQSLKEKVAVSSEMHFLLHHSGVLQCVCVECPEMEIGYDADTQQLCLKGTQADVYKAKCEVQEKVYTMTEKAIEVSPEVFQFLQQVDHKEFSKSFFIAQKNLTVYELKDTTVLLTSCSSEALVEAEKQMLSALNYKRIEVEDKKVLTGSKWKSFIGNIQKKSDSSSCIMVTNDLTVGSPAGIVVAGLVKEVNEIYSLIFDFLEKNMKIERLIEIKPSLVIDYLRAEKKQFWSKIKKGDVQVVFNPEHKQKGILLIGPKCHVLEGMNFVKEAEKSVFVKSVPIDKPGARQFFQDKAWFYRGEVRKLYGCFIELLENEEKVGGKTDGQKYLIQTEVAPGIFLMVQQGDLTQFPVSAVVNAANEDLKHIAGLAAALSRAAGPELQADCDKIVKRDSRLLPGNAVLSKAGRLPCQHVIHAVGPRWDGHEAPRCVYLLKKAVENSLLLAEKHKCRSIAIPAISSGVFGFPLQQCVESIVLSIKENFQHKQDGWTLKEIYLVDSLEKTAEAFAKVVKTIFKCPVLGRSSPPGTVSQPDTTSLHSAPAANPVAASQEIAFLTAPGGLKILLVKKCLQDATTHVVVNSIPSDLGLYRGPLSQALLEKAGPEIQKELYTAGQGVTASVGTILQTSGCNLQCRRVLHVVTPSWTNNTSAREIMEDIIRDCLEITERLSLQSIAFPAIGTGNLGFPKTILAELLLSTVLEFSSKKPLKTLQEVHLLMHPSDRENIQAFSVEFAKRINGKFSDKVPKAEDKQELYGTVSSPNLGMHEIKIGPIIFQVASGDITKEAADVIVNSTSNRFNLKAGVSKAILENAGQEVEQECALLGQQGKNEYIITKGGSLMCKNIIHVVGGNDVKRSVFCVLQETEKRSYSSICLPAIGTGSAGQDQNKVAEAMLDAIEDFIQKESVQYVKKVKVVIFQSKVLDVFYASMKKREGSQASHQPSLISKFASFFGFSKPPHPKKKALVLEKKTELVVFQLCGENRNCVDQAVRWLEALIAKEQYSYTNTDECIKDFDEKEYQELNELQKKLNITISLDQKRPFIEVLGITRDVMEARDKIEEMMKKVRLAKEEENRADCISEFIEWRYGEDNTFHRFDKITNLQLEDARKAKNKSTVVIINNQSYTVNLKDSTARSPDGHSVIIQRFTKSEVDLPGYWSDMKQQNLCVVQLQPGDVEFNTVAGKFNQTCSQFVIEKIERIQNPDLWNSYQAKKKTMDSKNSQGTNEKLLFHGTDVDSVPYVNRNGFNRSYAGKNAVAYGKGTYFAVNANYSANDIYSKPDANGKKHMYYVRVLTGMYTNGHSSLIVPPSKVPQNPTDLYDTVTDNKHNPSLFVVFYDYQAYPEYLITFRR